jgi:capsular polysaccharide biosynthesis protein/Mrp family chromosome partitioning ATPase
VELSGYFAVARRWWWTLLVATWVAAMAGLLVASRIPPTYEAQAQLLVGPINTDADTLKASGQLVQTYAQLAVSTPLLKSTAQEIPGLDPTKLASAVRTTASDVTRVLQIRVQDSDPARAAQIANTMSDELIQLTTGATTRPEGQLEVISLAVPPTSPIAPQISLIVLLAMAAGLIGGLVLVILVEYATDMVRDSGDLARLARTDVLATIAFEQRTPGKDPLPVAAAAAPGSANAVAFRLLASKIAVRDGEAPTRTILVTAVGSGDSAVGATGIAAAVAASGRRVVVVDGAADSDITQTLKLGGRSGLREAASGDGGAAPEPVNGPVGIQIVPSGVEGSVELLPVDRSEAILAALLADHDLVVIDGGAVQRSTGALGWARVADHTVVLVRRSMSRRDELRQAMESLRYVNARISGTVLVQRTASRGWRPGRTAAVDPGRSSRPATAPSSATEAGTSALFATPPSGPIAASGSWPEPRRTVLAPDPAVRSSTETARPIVWSAADAEGRTAPRPAWHDVPARVTDDATSSRTASLEARLAASRPADRTLGERDDRPAAEDPDASTPPPNVAGSELVARSTQASDESPAEPALPPAAGRNRTRTRTRRGPATSSGPVATGTGPESALPSDERATEPPIDGRRRGRNGPSAPIVTLLPSAGPAPERPRRRREPVTTGEAPSDDPTPITRPRAPGSAASPSAADR